MDSLLSTNVRYLDVLEEIKNLPNTRIGVTENDYPINVFPSPFKELIIGCERSLNFPPDFFGTAILSAVSTAIGKSAKAKVKNGWYEFPSLYVSLIGNPGTNKSHPLDTAFKPLIERDRIIINEYKAAYEAYEEYLSLSKKDKKDNIDNGQCEKPVLLKTVLHNFTPEILQQRLQDNPRGNIVLSEEIATFIEGMNNYSKGDNSSAYLSFWSNKGTSIDRVGKPIPLFIQEPFLNIIGTLQPKVLPKVFPVTKTNSGFLQRFLFAFPDNVEKQPINDNELDDDLIKIYSSWINTYISKTPIVCDEEGVQQSKLYYWTNEAKEYFYKWHSENTALVNENAESLMGEVLTKFDIQFVRIALILQIMEDYNTNKIGLRAVKNAKVLVDYYIKCSTKVIDLLESNKEEALPENKASFFKSLPEVFTTSEANALGLNFNMNQKAVQRFIKDDTYFKKLEHGRYSKL